MGNAVAEASIVLSVDATKLNSGMKSAANKAKSQGSELAKNFKASSSEKIGNIFGGDSLIAGAAKGGLIGLGVGAVALVGKELYELATNTREFHKELERGEEVSKRWAEGVIEGIGRAKERLTEFDDIAGTAEGLKAFKTSLVQSEGKLTDLGRSLEVSKTAAEEYDSKWNSFDSFHRYLNGQLDESHKSALKTVEDHKQAQEAARKFTEELRRRNAELADPSSSVQARTALRQFVKEQEDAVKDLNRSADESKLAKLQERFGFKGLDLVGARLAITAKNAANAEQFIKSLRDEVDQLATGVQKTTEETKLDEFVKLGIDNKQIARIKELIELKKEQGRTYNPLKPIEAGTWEAIHTKNEVKFNEDKVKGLKQEKQLNEVIQKLIMINLSINGLDLESPTI